MEDSILEMMVFLEGVDFIIVFQAFGVGLFVFWLVIIGWAAIDASERLESKWLRLLAVVLVIILPLFGLLIYLTIRPKETLEESKWSGAERRYLKFETAGLYDCPSCGYEVFPNYIFCPNCGYELRFKCTGCDVYLEPEWNTCPYCGEDQPYSSRRKFAYLRPKDKKKQHSATVAPPVVEKEKESDEEDEQFHTPVSSPEEEEVVEEKAEEVSVPDEEELEKEEYKKKDESRKSTPKRKDPPFAKIGAGFKSFFAKADEVVKKIGAAPISAIEKRKTAGEKEEKKEDKGKASKESKKESKDESKRKDESKDDFEDDSDKEK